MSDGQIQVDTASFGPASDLLIEVGDGISALEDSLANQTWYPADAWRTAAVFKLLQASGEASLAQLSVGAIAGLAYGVADHLVQAQAWYESVDAEVVAAFTEISDTVTTAFVMGLVNIGIAGAGALVATLATPGGIAVVVAGGLAYYGLEQAGLAPSGEDVGDWLASNQHVLANPMMVTLVRAITSGGDEIITEAAAGVTGFAGGVLFGTLGAVVANVIVRQAVTSPQAAAGTIADIMQRKNGNYRYDIEHTERGPVAAPESISDLMQSIPQTEPEGTHVTVSEYLTPEGETVYVVSIAGTSSTGFGGENPMDNLSNLAAYAGQDDETIGAAISAMEQAGISPGDSVVLTGYSQGALVAAELASSGEWETQSVLLAGSPIHGNEIGGDIPVVQLEHSGDLITGLQGLTAPATGEVAVVTRDPYPEGVPPDKGILGPHMLHTYQDTAALYDAHEDASAAANRDAVLGPVAGATPVATHDFHLQREYPEPQAAADGPTGSKPGDRSPVPSLLPDLGSLTESPLTSPSGSIGFLGVDEALGSDAGPPSMPDAFGVTVPSYVP
ncbi:hypothetical protein [Gulosibacter molinativorax]|uniref:PE-PPE domain-containing protein n=1 Tax=Gulosibacter molinativorax TaxID=256821 RepID=A0ABT7C975_9MICO|nr:hypothetical protein [Gulosibacter molinativorax]MDJ1371737.1 hypothetical protein [Gulosibacter molinativorax]QUY63159.1 Hypotetical protein [Gulosibacter molinativorax]